MMAYVTTKTGVMTMIIFIAQYMRAHAQSR
jgi:hypothetical protein